MKKIFLGLILGVFLQKGLTSANWYSWNYYQKQCRQENPEMKMSESFKCAEKKQGILRYLYIASGTITPDFSGKPTWRY
jgi:hypothetical protein